MRSRSKYRHAAPCEEGAATSEAGIGGEGEEAGIGGQGEEEEDEGTGLEVKDGWGLRALDGQRVMVQHCNLTAHHAWCPGWVAGHFEAFTDPHCYGPSCRREMYPKHVCKTAKNGYLPHKRWLWWPGTRAAFLGVMSEIVQKNTYI